MKTTAYSFYISTIMMFLLVFTACKKEPTTWSSDWSAPVINDELTLKNLVNDSTLELNGLGSYNVILSRKLMDLNLSDVVSIPDTTINKGITIIFPTLTVPPGFTFVNTAEENEIYPGDAELKEITVREGKIAFTVFNPLQTKINFNINLPGTTKNGVPFDQTYEVPASVGGVPGQATQSFDISGYAFDLTGLNANKNNFFVSQIAVTSDPNGPSVTMTNNDSIRFDAAFKDIKLDYARGYFGNSLVSDTITEALDILNSYQSGLFDLPNMSLELVVENGVKVGGQTTIHLVSNTNANNSTVALTHNQIGQAFTIDPATGTWGSLTSSTKSILFNSSNSNIESYLENMGSTHTIGYSIQLNPWGNVSGGWDVLYPDSKLSIGVNMSMPLKVGLDNFILKDTFDLDLTSKTSGTRITEGALVLKATNSFPLTAELKIYLINTNDNIEFTVLSSTNLESGLSGTIDPGTGLFTKESELVFELPENIIEKLSDIKKICVEAIMNTPDPTSGVNQQYDIPENAALGIKVLTRFKSQNEL